MTYSIDILKVGRCDVRGPEVYWMSHWEAWLPLQFHMLVVRGGGKTIVVNTGPPADLTEMNKAWVDYMGDERGALKVEPEDRPEKALPAIGVDPNDVDMVIVTPFQQYSISNLKLFSKAEICLSRHGWIEFQAPTLPMPLAQRRQSIPDDVLTYLSTEAWERVRLMEDEEELLPGLRTFRTGAHHPESTAVAIETKAGTAIFADCIFHYGNIEKDHPLGIAENIHECKAAYARIREEADVVLAPYDPEILERHPDGTL